MKLQLPLLGLAAVLLSGCGSGFRNWTARTNPADGAILFEANTTDDNTSGYEVGGLDLNVYPIGEKKYLTWARVGSELKGGPVEGFKEKLFILKLPPGLYGTTLSLWVRAALNGVPHLDPPGGAFQNFKVEPGKVTVLGSLDVAMKLRKTATGLSWADSTTTYDDRLPERQRIAKAAALRPEAVSGNWKALIDSAVEDLAAAK